MSVTELDSYRPHVAIHSGETAHVIPVSLIEDWIEGKAELDVDVARAIMADWLRAVK